MVICEKIKVRNSVSNAKQKVVINGTTLDWILVITGVLQDSVHWPTLFGLSKYDIDVGLRNFIAKFANNGSHKVSTLP